MDLVWAKNVENLWQYSKVYTWDWDAQAQRPKDSYWTWATDGWSKTRAERYPVGKNVRPECSWWRGKALSYVQARAEIYLPVYASSVIHNPVFQDLLEWYETEEEPTIVDFDVYDKQDISYTDVFLNPNRRAGHGFVLGAMLEYGGDFFLWLEDLTIRAHES